MRRDRRGSASPRPGRGHAALPDVHAAPVLSHIRELRLQELQKGLRGACGQWAVHAGVRARLSLLRWHGFVRDAGRVRGTRREYLKAVASVHARRGVDKSPRCYAFICTVHTSHRLDTARARAASPPCAGAPLDVLRVCGRVCNRTSLERPPELQVRAIRTPATLRGERLRLRARERLAVQVAERQGATVRREGSAPPRHSGSPVTSPRLADAHASTSWR
mmetsp:Transcript_3652/g.14762  ORF Transcript_3652/g.14762 Transcript_3652/m.14762 type:complete len:220 (+) Transcript_3652:1134-1793(+)